MGNTSIASGVNATAIGYSSSASGNYSTAIGPAVSISGAGSFITGDNSATPFTQSGTNRYYARFANGYYLYTNDGFTIGALLGAGANSWAAISDSTKKENFKSVDGEDFLNKINQFKLTSWNYKGQDPNQFRHYGPMAQDFYAAFGNDGIGTIGNDTTLASADFDGINFIAIQALEKRTTELKSENDKLKSELEFLKSKMAQFESALEKMEKLSAINSNANQKEYAHLK